VKFIPAKLFHQTFSFVLLLGVWVALTGTSMAQNQYYVNASAGSDSTDGSQARPWRTIQHADAALALGSGGTTVHVAPGTYSGPITTNKSGTASARIVWLSDTKWGAKITNINWVENGSFVDINGFDGTSPAGPNAFGVQAFGNSVHVLNNNFHDFNVSGCASAGVVGGRSFQAAAGGPANRTQDMLIQGNIIRHGGNYNPSFGIIAVNCVEFHGIYDGGVRTIIQNNVISGITGWGIKSDCITNTVISNNTIFNNGGGIAPTELNDNGFCAIWDYSTITNNIIVNNGVDTPSGGRYGLNFYHVTGTHNNVSNNLIYGNKPADYAHHDVTCAGGAPISGSDANGTAGGCPSANPKSDASTAVTFTNFQFDGPSAPASNYDPDNYQIKAGSSAIQNGTTNCASSPGVAPCVPTLDILGVPRLLAGATLDIGAYEQGSVARGVPSAPTGLTAAVQ
jgi:hypothetical protein